MKRIIVLCCMIFFLSSFCHSAGFKNSKARLAQKKYLDTMSKAKKEYDKKIELAKKKYKTELKSSLKESMKKEDLKESNKIKKEIDCLEIQTEKDIKKILFSQKWSSGSKESVITFHKDGTVTTKNGKKAHWKIEDKTLYIRWSSGWEPAVKLSQKLITIKNSDGEGYTWIAK